VETAPSPTINGLRQQPSISPFQETLASGSWRSRAKAALRGHILPTTPAERSKKEQRTAPVPTASATTIQNAKRRATVLVAHASAEFGTQISARLHEDGLTPVLVGSVREVLSTLSQQDMRLILLDRALRSARYPDLCRTIKATSTLAEVPIILLSAIDNEADRVRGFESGIDDYVCVPCSLRELSLRVRAVLHRTERWIPDRLVVGPIAVDNQRNLVYVRGEALALPETEMRLLIQLAKHVGVPQDRKSLLTEVWGDEPTVHARTVDTCIQRLRTKLGAAGDLIQTVRGHGYCFVV
jgi:two-component system phosphate regulon response regulator PhoB